VRDGGEDAGAVARVVVARTGAAVIQTRRQHAGVAQNLFQTTPREKKTKKTLRNNQRLMDFVCVCVCVGSIESAAHLAAIFFARLAVN